MPQVSSLEGTAREGLKETGEIFERENLLKYFYADFLGAVAADLATGSLRFLKGKGGKLDLEENKRQKREPRKIQNQELALRQR